MAKVDDLRKKAIGAVTSRRTPSIRHAMFLIPLVFLAVFFFYPLGSIISQSLTIEAVQELLSKTYYWEIVLFTFFQALLSTMLTLVIGLPAAFLFARFTFPGKSLLRALVTVPFVLPTVVVAISFRALLGPTGPVNSLLMDFLGFERAPLRLEQTLGIILLAHIYYNLAVVIRLIGGFWAGLSPEVTDAARVLGASRFRAFWEVTFPILRPAIGSASLLIFLFTFTSFGVILILGGADLQHD